MVRWCSSRRGCVRTDEGSCPSHRNHDSPSFHPRPSGHSCQHEWIYGWLRGEDSGFTEGNRAVETIFSFRFHTLCCLMKAALEKPGSRAAKRGGKGWHGRHRLDARCPPMSPTSAPHTSTATPALAPFQRGPCSSYRDRPLQGQVDNRGAWGGGLETGAGTAPGLGSPSSAHKATGGVGAGLGAGLTSPWVR